MKILTRFLLTEIWKDDTMVDNPLAMEAFHNSIEYENVVCAFITGMYDFNIGLTNEDNPYPLMSLEYCSWLDATIRTKSKVELHENS